MSDETSTDPGRISSSSEATPAEPRLGLLIAWSQEEPARVGEQILLPRAGREALLGRGGPVDGDEAERAPVAWVRQGHPELRPPLGGKGLSRRQLRLRGGHGEAQVDRVGRVPMRHNGKLVESARVRPGDLITLEQQLVLLCVERAIGVLPVEPPTFAFGKPDPFGMVGESSRAWALRAELAFYAGREGHVLLLGPSGAGKELAARTLHGLSSRASRPFVARNAATLPSGLVDAELFGNVRNYPNAGMPERPGLVGEAHGGTLFLDEIGELPEEMQAHLLRLLDGGDYHRLGEASARRADVRVIAATNRDEDALKHDLLARFKLRVEVPGLDARRDDIPLLIRATLQRLALQDPRLRARFFDGDEARISPDLIEALLRHGFSAHTREIEMLLLLAMAGSQRHFVELTPSVQSRLRVPRALEPPTRAQIEASLAAHNGNVSAAWRDLGLSSRDALNRLIKKLGIPRPGG